MADKNSSLKDNLKYVEDIKKKIASLMNLILTRANEDFEEAKKMYKLADNIDLKVKNARDIQYQMYDRANTKVIETKQQIAKELEKVSKAIAQGRV